MIEVEKKFQPTEEQLEKLLADSEFMGEKNLDDIYYDYSDYRLLEKEVRFRSRNSNFELKIGKKSGTALEIEDPEEIKKYFNTDLNLEDFIKQNLKPFISYTTNRKKYKNGDFVIDVDSLSFGYDVVEIELLVENEDQVEDAESKILEFAKKYDFEIKKIPAKRAKYLEIIKPELYKELYN